jgi:hypothetical protein
MTPIPDLETANIVRAELSPGEHLLWSGHPRQGVMLQPSEIAMIPFNLVLTGIFAAVYTAAHASSAPVCVPVFLELCLVYIVLMDLYMPVGRSFLNAAQRTKTYSGLTDRRVLIISGLLNRNVRSFSLCTLPDVKLSVDANGRGTLTFGPVPGIHWGFSEDSFGWTSDHGYELGRVANSFEGIENARAVYDQIIRAQQNAMAQ